MIELFSMMISTQQPQASLENPDIKTDRNLNKIICSTTNVNLGDDRKESRVKVSHASADVHRLFVVQTDHNVVPVLDMCNIYVHNELTD